MPDRGKKRNTRHLSVFGKEVQKMYDKREISYAYYTKLINKRKCWTYI